MAATRSIIGIDIGGTSIKAAVMEGEREVWKGRSVEYARPEREELAGALRGVIGSSPVGRGDVVVERAGVCAPGLRDGAGVIVRAVNVPGLEGMSAGSLVQEVLFQSGTTLAKRQSRGTVQSLGMVSEFTDAHAAAVDFWYTHPGRGRLLAISMGTGIGACVLDAGEGEGTVPLIVTGRGPGQIGQMDVSAGGEGEIPLGPDGGRGTLEAYLGLPALRARFGMDLSGLGATGALRAERMPLAALVRGLRIAHAIYLPSRIALLGGVGMALGSITGEIRAAVGDGLTSLARPDWTLEAGTTSFHAARGAARLAGEIADERGGQAKF